MLVSDGKKLWSHDADLKQSSVQPLGATIGANPAALLAGRSIERNFILKNLPSQEGWVMLEATPVQAESSFQRLRLGFANNLPRYLELHDNFGQVTQLRLEDLTQNRSVAARSFVFTPATAADVIKVPPAPSQHE